MSTENACDPRTTLVREKFFSLRPKPLERWLWQQGLPQAAERVFWLHWEEGMKRGDWCSELALRQVARECCMDTSTVTRAYQLLKGLELIRRQDPGRDPANPFQQAVAVTEVRVPLALVRELDRAPNRAARRQPGTESTRETANTSTLLATDGCLPDAGCAASSAAPVRTLSRAETAALMQKLSAQERCAFFVASRDRLSALSFDAATALTPDEQGSIVAVLAGISAAKPTARVIAPPSAAASLARRPPGADRRLSPLEAARVRKAVLVLVPATAGAEVFRQVLWSVERGALRRFDARLAVHIALKKIREGAWSRPHRMPPHWLSAARPETCGAA